MLLLLSFALQILAFDAIIDLGCGTYQVGTLKKSTVGNPVEMILNSQSKRHTPSLVAYDGEVFFAGEQASIFQKRTPGLVFSGFTAGIMGDALNYAGNPDAPELAVFKDQPATTLLTALINHLVHTQINKPNETISVTLTIPPGLSIPEISAIRDAIEVVPNVKLLTTVPIPVATAITYLSSRIGGINRTAVSSISFVVVDFGYHSTDVSIVEALLKADSTDVQMRVVATDSAKIGGHTVTEALIKRFVEPKIPGFSASSDLRRYRRIYEAVERAKTTLSANTETRILIESVMPDGSDLHLTLTREQLNALLDELYSDKEMQHFASIRSAVNEKHKDAIFYFYGAASRALHLQAKMEAFFNTTIQKTVNLDEGAIYGAALIAARYGSGHRVSYKFIASDQTRPELVYVPNRLAAEESDKLSADGSATIPLMRLNPYQRKGINNDIFPYAEDEFIVSNQTFNISLEKEIETEVDDTEDADDKPDVDGKDADTDFDVAEGEPFDAAVEGDSDSPKNETEILERLKKALANISTSDAAKAKRKAKSISIAPHEMTARWLSTKTTPFYQMNVSAKDLLNITCNFSFADFKPESVLDKYQLGSIVKERDLIQMEKDLKAYNTKVELVLDNLKKYIKLPQPKVGKKQRKEDVQDTRDIKVKFLVNITTDSASIPSISFAAIQLQNWTEYNKELADNIKNKKADKRPKAKVKAIDIELERRCNTTFHPSFVINKTVYANGYKLIEAANQVMENRNHLSHSVNEIESIVYTAKELLEKHPPSIVNEGDVLIYASEGEDIVRAMDNARLFMEKLEEMEPCGVNNSCVVERLESTNSTVNGLREVMKVVSARLAQIRCIEALRDGFESYIIGKNYTYSSLLTYSDLLAAEPVHGDANVSVSSVNYTALIDRMMKLNETMAARNIAMPFNSTREQLVSLHEAALLCRVIEPIDSDSLVKDYQDEEEQLESAKLEAEKEQKNKSWFKKMIGKSGTEIEEAEKKILYTKDVIRRLKRAKVDCSTFTKSAERLKAKSDQVAALYNKAADMYNNMKTEFKLRPQTNCTEVTEARAELDKAIREVRWQITHIQDIVKTTKIDTLTNEIRKMSDRAQNHLSYAKSLFKLLTITAEANLEEATPEVHSAVDEMATILRKLRVTTVSDKLLKYLRDGGLKELQDAGLLVAEPSEQTFDEYNNNVTSIVKKALVPVADSSTNITVNSTTVNATANATDSAKKEEL